MDEWAGRLARAYAACRGTHPEDIAVLAVDDRALLDERGRPRPGRGAGNDGELHRDAHEAAKNPPGVDVA